MEILIKSKTNLRKIVAITSSFWQKKTSHNIVFAKGGVEYIIEKPDAFSRNLLFILLFFVIW